MRRIKKLENKFTKLGTTVLKLFSNYDSSLKDMAKCGQPNESKSNTLFIPQARAKIAANGLSEVWKWNVGDSDLNIGGS